MDESVRDKHRLAAKRNGTIAVKICSDAMDQGLLARSQSNSGESMCCGLRFWA